VLTTDSSTIFFPHFHFAVDYSAFCFFSEYFLSILLEIKIFFILWAMIIKTSYVPKKTSIRQNGHLLIQFYQTFIVSL
jgi:hypothetical protein